MELNDFTFPVSERSLYEVNLESLNPSEDYRPINGYKGIYNSDTNELISIVGSNYTLRTNAEVFEKTLGVLEKNGIGYMLDPMSSLLTNARMRCHIWLTGCSFNDGESPVHLSMFIQNSYDMSSTFKFKFGAYRLICLNGAHIFYKQMNQIFRKHTRNFYVDDLMGSVERATKLFPEFQTSITQLRDTPVSIPKYRPLVEKLMGKTFELHMLREKKWGHISTYYDLYNEMTWFVTHKVPASQKEMFFEKITKAFKV